MLKIFFYLYHHTFFNQSFFPPPDPTQSLLASNFKLVKQLSKKTKKTKPKELLKTGMQCKNMIFILTKRQVNTLLKLKGVNLRAALSRITNESSRVSI